MLKNMRQVIYQDQVGQKEVKKPEEQKRTMNKTRGQPKAVRNLTQLDGSRQKSRHTYGAPVTLGGLVG